MNATNSACSDSDNNDFILRRNSRVSTTVMGACAMFLYYTQFAQGATTGEGPQREFAAPPARVWPCQMNVFTKSLHRVGLG